MESPAELQAEPAPAPGQQQQACVLISTPKGLPHAAGTGGHPYQAVLYHSAQLSQHHGMAEAEAPESTWSNSNRIKSVGV